MTLLKLDYDGKLPKNLLPWITQCCRLWRWPLVAVRFDRTRRGWHVVVGVRARVELAQGIAAQAIWGSDTKREMLNLMRVNSYYRGEVPESAARLVNVLFHSHRRGVRIHV